MARDGCLARVTTGVALGGAVGGAVGAVYGTYEAIRYKLFFKPDKMRKYHISFFFLFKLLKQCK
ncbi:hypothetical protein DsansV1_C07g0071751 [Dioscorea sansibarensis]